MATHDQQSFAGRVTESFRTVTGEWLSASALMALISQGVRPVVDNVTVFATTHDADGNQVADDKDALRAAADVLKEYAELFGVKVDKNAVRQGVRDTAERTNRATGEQFTSPRAVYLSLPMNSSGHLRSLLKEALASAPKAPAQPQARRQPSPVLDDLPF